MGIQDSPEGERDHTGSRGVPTLFGAWQAGQNFYCHCKAYRASYYAPTNEFRWPDGHGLVGCSVSLQEETGACGAPTGGKKFDQGKAPLAQGCIGYFRKALEEVAHVSAYGARKYSVEYADQNWRHVDGAAGRYLDALARHLAAHAAGEQTDPESSLRHLAHAAWNALALLELIR